MDSNQIGKPLKKGRILSAVFYVFAVVLLITAVVSLAACHQNISAQLEQGVPVKGNELAIVNLYLSSCVQYFALAAVTAFCGIISRKLAVAKAENPAANLLCGPQEIPDTIEAEPVETEEDDFEAWGFREQEK